MSEKMNEFLDKVDSLCFEYGFSIYPTVEGWTGGVNEQGENQTFAIVGNGEAIKIMYLDGDGRGK